MTRSEIGSPSSESPANAVYDDHSLNSSDYMNMLPKDSGSQRDISSEAVWSLSSCKVEGFGINQLLDERIETYWQSDGPQPHTITIEFQKCTEISFLLMYLDYKSDESYTPQKVQVYTGNSILDLDEPAIVMNFNEPAGWQVIDLRRNGQSCVRAFVIQIQILQNHQSGRDTHVRACKVLGPRGNDENVAMTTNELMQAFKRGDIIFDYCLR